jgi:hypothetical protein
MHPFIAASLAKQLSGERVARRPRHPRRVSTRGTPEIVTRRGARLHGRGPLGVLHLRTP